MKPIVTASLVLSAIFAAAGFKLGSALANDVDERFEIYKNRTPEEFLPKIKLIDDALEISALIDSRAAWVDVADDNGLPLYDSWLSAQIDKNTGTSTFTLVAFSRYNGDWRFYDRANFMTTKGPAAIPAVAVDRQTLSCLRYTGCLHVEQAVFPINQNSLLGIAKNRKDGIGLVFKIKSKTADGDWISSINGNEIQALLIKVDEYRAAKGFAAIIVDDSPAK